MNSVFRHMIYLVRGLQVYALVGRSGTGKSFRAKLVAQKFGIPLIIDDGLLIKDQKIVAGRSAKKEKAYLGAIKTALFDDRKHRTELQNALRKEKFKRILIIGTSEKMVRKITERLELPHPYRILNIEEIASREDIEQAIRSRHTEGKHVIPVPAIEVSRSYGHIFYESIKVFIKKKFSLPIKGNKNEGFEKSVVRPQFGRKGKVSITEAALAQMVIHCAEEYDASFGVKKVTVNETTKGYRLAVHLQLPLQAELAGKMHNFQQYIVDSLEKYSGVMIDNVDVIIDKIKNKA